MTDKTKLPEDVASATQTKKIDESLEFDLKDKQSLKTSDDRESLLIALNCNGSAAYKRSIAIKCNNTATSETLPHQKEILSVIPAAMAQSPQCRFPLQPAP
nr:hypothetical protein [uncultured Cohaesibacter sp.]